MAAKVFGPLCFNSFEQTFGEILKNYIITQKLETFGVKTVSQQENFDVFL
jgi:hypothetical protein